MDTFTVIDAIKVLTEVVKSNTIKDQLNQTAIEANEKILKLIKLIPEKNTSVIKE